SSEPDPAVAGGLRGRWAPRQRIWASWGAHFASTSRHPWQDLASWGPRRPNRTGRGGGRQAGRSPVAHHLNRDTPSRRRGPLGPGVAQTQGARSRPARRGHPRRETPDVDERVSGREELLAEPPPTAHLATSAVGARAGTGQRYVATSGGHR